MNGGFWLTRLVFQRALAAVYLIAFLTALNQFRPLLGERGLLPAPAFIRAVPFSRAPSLFYLRPTDAAFAAAAWLGLILSVAALTGLSERANWALSAAVWAGLWLLCLSFVNVGQEFYGFGWESLLCEAGFYAIFLGPSRAAPPAVLPWLYRWLLFRVMFGAGLIKLRGDSCWRDLTCLDYYFETQPMPNPVSWFAHWAPPWLHRAGVLVNHAAELAVPFGYAVPGDVCAAAGLATILFQASIMLTGNLSFLNLLTMAIAIPALNDRWLAAVLPAAAAPAARDAGLELAAAALALLILALSAAPALNMFSPGQVMNTSYNPLHLGGSYGAFGSITRTRYEIVVEGSAEPDSEPPVWLEYEFKGKPGDPARRPPQIAPYHLRLDWLMWFAAMGPYQGQRWFLPMIQKLLEGDPAVLGLLRVNPFPGAPPRQIRARLFEYRFTRPEERRATGRWWTRRPAGDFLPPVSLPAAAR